MVIFLKCKHKPVPEEASLFCKTMICADKYTDSRVGWMLRFSCFAFACLQVWPLLRCISQPVAQRSPGWVAPKAKDSCGDFKLFQRAADVQRLGTVLFGQFLAVCRHHQRRVQVLGWLITQRLLQHLLPGSVVGQVFAPDDVRDALRSVIDDHRKLVGPQAVCTLEDEIADVADNVLSLIAQAPVSPPDFDA